MPPVKHAQFSASSSARLLACPGALKLGLYVDIVSSVLNIIVIDSGTFASLWVSRTHLFKTRGLNIGGGATLVTLKLWLLVDGLEISLLVFASFRSFLGIKF